MGEKGRTEPPPMMIMVCAYVCVCVCARMCSGGWRRCVCGWVEEVDATSVHYELGGIGAPPVLTKLAAKLAAPRPRPHHACSRPCTYGLYYIGLVYHVFLTCFAFESNLY